MADPNEAGGWVIDPKNPNRATYTDDNGDVYEMIKPSVGQSPAPASPAVEETRLSPSTPPPARQGVAGQVLDVAQGIASKGLLGPAAQLVGSMSESSKDNRGSLSRFIDAYGDASQYGFPGLAARRYHKWAGTLMPELRSRYPGLTDEAYEKMQNELISASQRGLREDALKRQERDPAWRPDEAWYQNALSVDRWLPTVAGHLFGGLGPEAILMPGSTGGQRVAGQAGIAGVSELGYEGLEAYEGVRDNIDPTQVLAAAALGGVFQGGLEGLRRLRGDTGPSKVDFEDETPVITTVPDDIKAGWDDILKSGSYEDAVAFQKNLPEGLQVNGKQLKKYFDARDAGQTPARGATYEDEVKASPEGGAIEKRLAEEANAFLRGDPAPAPAAKPKPVKEPDIVVTAERRTADVDAAVADINETVKGWKNAPDIEVTATHAELPKDLRKQLPKDFKAVFLSDGRVIVNLENISHKGELRAAIYHESLGHYGLAQRFSEELENQLEKMYTNSEGFRARTDEWLEQNPEAYKKSSNRTLRAAEEVLAEDSQTGRVEKGLLDPIKDSIKNFARDMGMEWNFSDREVRSILAEAHDAVIKREASVGGVFGDEQRYMYAGESADNPPRWEGEWFKGPDGQRRFEINDQNARINEDELNFSEATNRYVPLRDVLHHPALYEQYPELRDLKINQKPSLYDYDKTYQGWFNPDNGTITVTPYAKDKRSTILHELQHWIQDIEGFARGGNAETAVSKMSDEHVRDTAASYHNWIKDKTEKLRTKAHALRNFQDSLIVREWQIAYDTWNHAAAEKRKYSKTIPDVYERINDPTWQRLDAEESKAFNAYRSFDDQIFEHYGLDPQVARNDKEIMGELSELKDAFIYSKDTAGREAKLRRMFNQLGENDTVLGVINQSIHEGDIQTLRYILSRDRDVSWQAYRSLFGEVEARDTQLRRDMTRAERKATKPYTIEGEVDPSAYIYDMNRGGISAEAEPKFMSDRTSKASKNPDKISLRATRLNSSPGEAAKTFLRELGVFNNGELMRMPAVEAVTRAERLGINHEWVDYFNDRRVGIKTPQPDMAQYLPEPRFMRPTQSPQSKTAKARERRKTYGSVNPEKINTTQDIDDILFDLSGVTHKQTKTWAETEAEALARGIQPNRVLRRKNVTDLTATVRAANIALAQQFENVMALEARLRSEGYSYDLHEKTIAEMARLKALHSYVQGQNSEVGRALNILRQASSSKQAAGDMIKEFNNPILNNAEDFMKFMRGLRDLQASGNEAGASRAVADVFKPGWEQYVLRPWYNMLLSSPATHVANFVGTGMNFAADLLENTGAAVIGQARRGNGNIDRVRMREVMYRIWGATQALKTAETWKNTRQTLNDGIVQGRNMEKTGNQNVYTGDNKTLQLGSGVLESPTRALAGADEFWRNVLQLSNIYGLAVRNAGNKGLKGKQFWAEVRNQISNPTKEMMDASNDYTKVTQFQDRASWIGRKILEGQAVRPDDGAGVRAAKLAFRLALPFIHTPDALIRTAIRRTPLGYIPGAMERENAAAFAVGGAPRDKALARIALGSSVAALTAMKAAEGVITGNGPSEPNKRQEWSATHQPQSILYDGKYYSYAGLEPVSTVPAAIATLVEKYKSGEIDGKTYGEQALQMSAASGNAMIDNTYLENFQNLMDSGSRNPNTAQAAVTNYLVNVGASTVPAIVRKFTQSDDPAVRDTTGDGSLGDRMSGRVKSSLPGSSRSLPQRYDVYGRPITRDIAGPDTLTRFNTKSEEKDPTILELQRLSSLSKSALVTPPQKTITVDGEKRRLNAEEFQKYQQLSGFWILESVREEMESPEWSAMTDKEKIDTVNDIKKAMRANARDELFPPKEEETIEEEDYDDES